MNKEEHKLKIVTIDKSDIVQPIENYIVIEPDLPKSKHFNCGKRRLAYSGVQKDISEEMVGIIAHHCYEMQPLGKCKLTIRFIQKGKPIKPKGDLVIKTERGKLSKQFVKLDGKTESVEVQYTAPDETIKNSIRARMSGFVRGKIHLHFIEQ